MLLTHSHSYSHHNWYVLSLQRGHLQAWSLKSIMSFMNLRADLFRMRSLDFLFREIPWYFSTVASSKVLSLLSSASSFIATSRPWKTIPESDISVGSANVLFSMPGLGYHTLSSMGNPGLIAVTDQVFLVMHSAGVDCFIISMKDGTRCLKSDWRRRDRMRDGCWF